MISSPCANCQWKNQPKELCANDCEILEAIQLYQVSNDSDFFISAIDCTEEEGCYLNLHSPLFVETKRTCPPVVCGGNSVLSWLA
jgi:hypothetical protein